VKNLGSLVKPLHLLVVGSLLVGGLLGLVLGRMRQPESPYSDPHFHSQIPRHALITDRNYRLNLEWLPKLNPALEPKTPVLLSFWAAWCNPCLAELPEINRLANLLSEDGLRVVLINMDAPEDLEKAKTMAQDTSPDIPFVFDQDGRLSKSWGVAQLPSHFLLTGDGQVYARWFGGVNWHNERVLNSIKSFLVKPESLLATPQ